MQHRSGEATIRKTKESGEKEQLEYVCLDFLPTINARCLRRALHSQRTVNISLQRRASWVKQTQSLRGVILQIDHTSFRSFIFSSVRFSSD